MNAVLTTAVCLVSLGNWTRIVEYRHSVITEELEYRRVLWVYSTYDPNSQVTLVPLYSL